MDGCPWTADDIINSLSCARHPLRIKERPLKPNGNVILILRSSQMNTLCVRCGPRREPRKRGGIGRSPKSCASDLTGERAYPPFPEDVARRLEGDPVRGNACQRRSKAIFVNARTQRLPMGGVGNVQPDPSTTSFKTGRRCIWRAAGRQLKAFRMCPFGKEVKRTVGSPVVSFSS